MSITVSTAPSQFMRQTPTAVWPEALNLAAEKQIAFATVKEISLVRTAALTALKKIGLPNSHSEDFSFLRLSELSGPLAAIPGSVAVTAAGSNAPPDAQPTLPNRETIQALTYAEADANIVVLVDGRFQPELSRISEHLQVNELVSANGGNILPPEFDLAGSLENESDPAAALAWLFAPAPILIRSESGNPTPVRIQILHFHADTSTLPARRRDTAIAFMGPRLSDTEIQVRHAGFPGGISNTHTVALLQEGAGLKYWETSDLDTGLNLRKFSARLDRNARLSVVSAHTGSTLARTAFEIDLAGEGAEADVNGATVLTGNRQAHTHVRVRHLVPHCRSHQHFKTVAADQARSSVDGSIYVAPKAQGTSAHQLINNLMLSDEARADCKPRLMIHADDVKCAHGATTGKLDPAQRFYLESRGLTAPQATTLMTIAFIAEILEKAGKPVPGGFRAALDHALLDTLKDTLKTKLPGSAKA